MADTDQQLVDVLNALRGTMLAAERRLEAALAGRRAEPDKRYTDGMKGLAAAIAGTASRIAERAREFKQGLPPSPGS
jgi:hypothetical protein